MNATETKEGMLDRIEREIVLMGPLTEEQRTRLLDIANKCPVRRTLTSEIKIVSWLASRPVCGLMKEVSFKMWAAP
jgi:uncharacterized OsmC-like protein